MGLVVTRAGGIPLVWHAYPGNRPDVTQFPALIDHLAQRYGHPTSTTGTGQGGSDAGTSMTVVFDAGQNSETTADQGKTTSKINLSPKSH